MQEAVARVAIKPTRDIPKPKPKQLGVFDALVDRDAIANDVSPVPLSERAILRQLEGSDRSGHRRKTFGEEVEELLVVYFDHAQELHGFDGATLDLFRLLSHEPDYVYCCPQWIRDLFEEQKDLLLETFANHRDDRRVEHGSSDDDEQAHHSEPPPAGAFEQTLQQLDTVLERLEGEEET